MDAAFYRDLVSRAVAGRRFVLTGHVLFGLIGQAQELVDLGAQRPFILAGITGTGVMPDDPPADWSTLGIGSGNAIEAIRRWESALQNLPVEGRKALDAYDPDGAATIIGSPFTATRQVAGRPVIGGRPAAWAALEDKVVCDELWDAAGVPRAPYEVVTAEPQALADAHRRLDRGAGTVWSADSSQGHSGAALHVRHVLDPGDEHGRGSAGFMAASANSVRVMPYLEGIPCSIHGIVFEDEVAAFRPLELLNFRRPGRPDFHHGGTSLFWDPAPDDREHMRRVVRQVGALLRERVDYRGGFGIDGVMTADGFRPTELNPRFSGGLNLISRVVPGVPLRLLHTLVVERELLDFRPRALESLMTRTLDQDRGGAAIAEIEQSFDKTDEYGVVRENDGWRLAEDGEECDGTLQIGPSGTGGIVFLRPVADRIGRGPSFAPLAARAFSLTDACFNTGIGELVPARSVR